jgi:hypothetical protein
MLTSRVSFPADGAGTSCCNAAAELRRKKVSEIEADVREADNVVSCMLFQDFCKNSSSVEQLMLTQQARSSRARHPLSGCLFYRPVECDCADTDGSCCSSVE